MELRHWNRVVVFTVALLIVSSVAVEIAAPPTRSANPWDVGRSLATPALVPAASQFTATLNVNPSQIEQGKSVNFQTTVMGGTQPYTFNYDGLPSGCASQDQASFTCTPSSTGSYQVSVMVTDSHSNQTTSNSAQVQVTSSNNGNGNQGGNGSNNPLANLTSGLGGFLSLLLIFGIVGFVTWILLVVGIWVIAITLLRRLPKRTSGAGPMVACPSCGSTMPSGAKFCSECGKVMAPKAP